MKSKFQIDEGLHSEYERIKERFLKRGHILAIKECPAALRNVPEQEQLETCGITGCTFIEYLSDTQDKGQSGHENIGGWHVGVMTDEGVRRSVIFMRNDYPEGDPPEFVIASKVCLLYHELGHADDFREQINFNDGKREYSARKAEAYADDFAKKHLKRIKCRKVVDGQERDATLWDWYSKERYLPSY